MDAIYREESFKKILMDRRKELEDRDVEIFKTRDKKYIPVKIQPRTLITELGKLTWKRHIYRYYNEDTNRWCYIALLDEEMGLKKWSKLDERLIEKIEDQMPNNKRYRDIGDMFPEAELSMITISRIFKKAKNKQRNKEAGPKIKVKPGQYIYINMDDTWPKVMRNNKKKKLKTRVISFNLGIDEEKSTNKRRKLKDKQFAAILGNAKNNIDSLAKWLIEEGSKLYDGFKEAKLIIGGDGAPWIRKLALKVGAKYVLDKYHAVKYFKKIFNIDCRWNRHNTRYYNLFKTCVDLFDSGKFDELMAILEIYADSETIKYFKKNRWGIENFGQPWNIGVSAESDVSNLVKSTFGYGSRTYSLEVFENIIEAKINYFNQNSRKNS